MRPGKNVRSPNGNGSTSGSAREGRGHLFGRRRLAQEYLFYVAVDTRIVFLRPGDSDDGSNGGAAPIEIDRERVGALHYGGFLFVDVKSSMTALTAFGRYRSSSVCDIDIAKTPGSIIYIDVGPRLSYMVAGAGPDTAV